MYFNINCVLSPTIKSGFSYTKDVIAIYVLIVFFSLALIIVTPVRVTNKTFVALKRLQLFNGVTIGRRLLNFTVSARIEDGVLFINDNPFRLKKRRKENAKRIQITGLLQIFNPYKLLFSVSLGSTDNVAAFAVVQGAIIMLFDIINNTREWKSPEIGTNLTILQDRNIAEAQLSVAININIFMIIRAVLLILFAEVRK